MSSPPIPQPQMLAAINALHEAEEAKLPISARVAAVATALGLVPAANEPADGDLTAQLERLIARLQQRVDAAPEAGEAAGDREAIAQACALLSRAPRAP